MDLGDRSYKYVQGVIHNPAFSLEQKMEKLRGNLLQNTGGHRKDFVEELFSVFFLSTPLTEEDLPERAVLVPAIVSLINEVFDDANDPFSRKQWHEIGEVASDFGTQLDESLLNYVMSRVVERGAL